MALEEKKREQILQKLLNPYLVMIIDEETFEEQAQLRTSRLKIFFITLLLLGAFSGLIFSIIAYTPIKKYIPGYDSSELRKKAVQNLFLTDSLITLYNQNILYLNSIRKVLTEDISFQDSESFPESKEKDMQNNPSVGKPILEDSLLRVFVAQQDKYSPNLKTKVKSNMFLFPPLFGYISEPFDINKSHYAVDIVAKENTPIKAISDGIVVFAEWTSETGYVIILEHSLGILSVYKHNSSLSKKQGDSVSGGEVIASIGNTGDLTTGYHLHFELWIDGYPVNPENFFNFSKE
ncbi:MAG: hypothetical protein CBD39_04020 [Flavobacteriaceae bacterium TMED179]|mgnify:FL=1|nr:MAG: hypothetical protein CBD39_04020 [Flavobacteriaceae bacterium TMED179]|tara:strand:- start:40123 stop:40998 length:876 start_codon:yes stop_codon:yes gene_type:complete